MVAPVQKPRFPLPDPGGLGEKVLNTIGGAIGGAFTDISAGFGDMARNGVVTFMDAMEAPLIRLIEPQLIEIRDNPATPTAVAAQATAILDRPHFVHLPMIAAMAVTSIVGALLAPIGVMQRLMTYQADKIARSNRLTPGEAFRAVIPGYLTDAQAAEISAEQGLPDDQLDAVRKGSFVPLGVSDVASAHLRGDQTVDWAKLQLARMGVGADDADQLIKLWQIIPGPSDLIRMAVREAFSPAQVTALDLDSEFPADVATWTAKQGLSEFWAKMFWRAHWELPSPTQAFEMFHRGLMPREDLDALIKAQDYAPVWRDRLLGISYNVFTRVDVRRMFDQGVLDQAGVLKSYKDAGYSPEDAQKLTEWTVAQKHEASKELVKSEVIGAYGKGIIAKDAASTSLTDMGYDAGEVGILLSLADYRNVQDDIGERENIVKELYLAGNLDDTQLAARLAELQISAARQDRLKLAWRRQRNVKPRRPSVEQCQIWASKGLMDEQTFLTELDAQGWGQGYINWFWQEIFPEPTASQLMTLWREQQITGVQFVERMQAIGYTKAQADEWLAAIKPELSLSDLRALLKRELMTAAEFSAELGSRGFSDAAIKQYIALSAPAQAKPTTAKPKKLTLAQLGTLVKLGKMTLVEYVQALADRGYGKADADRLLEILKDKLE